MKTRALIIFFFLFSLVGYSQPESKKSSSGKFGFTDDSGEWIIQPQYTEVEEFYDGPYAFVKLKGKWGLIDQKGNAILPFSYDKIANLDYGEDELYSVSKNKLYGMVSRKKGKEIVSCTYENNFYFDDSIISELDAVAIVYKNKKAGLLSMEGKEIVPCLYDGGKKPFTTLDYDAFYLVRQNKKAGVINSLGGLVVQCVYDDIKISDSESLLFEVQKNGKYGYCSIEGKEIIAPIYDKAFYYEGDFSLAKLKGNYGVINRKGETVVPFTYSKESDAFDKMMTLYEN